jgi:hypothetical protein
MSFELVQRLRRFKSWVELDKHRLVGIILFYLVMWIPQTLMDPEGQSDVDHLVKFFGLAFTREALTSCLH